MALTLKAVVGNEEIDTILPRCNWCLQYWGIRDNRQGYIEATQSWISRKIKLENGSVNNPNLAVITMERFREIQGHVGRLGKAIESLRKG
jgi:hypothetical protein